jgi:hypothetical protein
VGREKRVRVDATQLAIILGGVRLESVQRPKRFQRIGVRKNLANCQKSNCALVHRSVWCGYDERSRRPVGQIRAASPSWSPVHERSGSVLECVEPIREVGRKCVNPIPDLRIVHAILTGHTISGPRSAIASDLVPVLWKPMPKALGR